MQKMTCLVQEITVTPTGGATIVVREGDVVDFEQVLVPESDPPYTMADAVSGRESCFSVFVE